MPKKNPSTLSDLRDKFFQTAKIRWEFFKRSKAYKANPQKYGDQSPVEILLAAAKKEKGLKQALYEAQAFMMAMELSGSAIKFSRDKTKLRIEIDFKSQNCGPAVLCQVAEKIIHDQHAICSRIGLLPKKKDSEFKKPPRNWEDILRAGELSQKGMTYRQIGKVFFPRDQSSEGARIKAFNLVKQFRKMADGGYQDITFP